jgi:hypothetical protein
MTATHRLKGLGWLLTCVVVALAFYLVSLQVAAERKKLDDVNRQIAQAHNDMRTLETEFETRSNLTQLEKWNGDVLALSAPSAGQFLSGETALASLTLDGGNTPQVQNAALVIPSAPNAAPSAMPTPTPAVMQTAAVTTIAPKPVAATVSTAAVVRSAPRITPVVATARTASPRMQAVAMLDRKLLSDRTLGDLVTGARTETAALR